ncbi:RBP11-like subunits of RNA polymerase [Lentinula detonsa]|uniref:DNA-directed RNA polymerases I and III subunit RPAC2 n=1 Tax=Lentinula detonsa TaxID=2804962 RepID=A0A9W8P4D9_9AGAR|nr:RBP11-like subunits of RNA polymerase [Lentinula detonsa]
MATAEAPPKIRIMKGAASDLSAATYQVHDESHTMGNALRWMLMKNPKVEFCGYSVPHPSEPNIQIRIQMYDKLSSLQALIKALDDLDNLCDSINEAYIESLQNDDYEKWDEKS